MALVEIDGKINTGNTTDQTATVTLNFAFDEFDFKDVEGDAGDGTFFPKGESAGLHAGANKFVGDGEYRDIVGGIFNVNKRSNDFGELLEETLLGDGVAGVTATQIGTDTVRFEIEGRGGSTDTINLTGEYVKTFLSASGFGFDNTDSGINIGNKTSQSVVRDMSDPDADGNIFIGAGGGQAGLENEGDTGSSIDAAIITGGPKKGTSELDSILDAFAFDAGVGDGDGDIDATELAALIAFVDGGDAPVLDEGDGSFDRGDARLTSIDADQFTFEVQGNEGTLDTVQIFDYDLVVL